MKRFDETKFLLLDEDIQYLAKSRIKQIKDRQKKDNMIVHDWLSFSMNPQTEEDIRNRIKKEIENKDYCKYICLSYVCRYSILSEAFIEELLTLTDRVDWQYICQYQKLSEDFIERHKNDVLWNKIYKFQNLSADFKSQHNKDYQEALNDSTEEERTVYH